MRMRLDKGGKVAIASVLAIGLILLALIPGCTGGGSKPKEEGPITLSVVTSFPLDAAEHDGFRMFMDNLNKKSEGKIKIQVKGGPEAIPPNELAEAVSKGVVDMATLPEAYYPHLVPEVRAVKLTPFTPEQEREKGLYDLYNRIHQEKLRVYYLGKTMTGVPYHLFLNVPVNKADLKGITLRVSPTYKALVAALGGAQVNLPAGEIHTALERGVVKGYGWAGIGIIGAGWHEVTKYELDPGFYDSSTVLLVNLDVWNKLPEWAKKTLNETMIETEKQVVTHYRQLYQSERQERAKKGIKVIELPKPEADEFLKVAYDEAWKEVMQTAPENGPKIKELMQK